MSVAYFLAKRIHFSKGDDSQRVSPPAIRIAIAGIAIGVAVMLVTVAIVVGFKEEVRQRVTDFSGDIQMQALVANSTYELPPICISDSMTEAILSLPGIQGIEPFITKPAIIKTDDDFLSVVVKGKGSLPLTEEQNADSTGNEELGEREVMLSKTIADKMRLNVGDEAQFFFVQSEVGADVFAYGAEDTKIKVRKLTVKGIYETHFSEIDQQMVIGSLPLLQQVSGWDEDMVSAISISINDFDLLYDSYFDLIDLQLQDRQGTPMYVQTIEELNPQVFSWLQLLDTNVWVILILIAVVAAFTMISGLLIIILERTQMIGILKAQGLDNGRLRRVFLWVALFLTGKGMIWGNAIGLGLCLAQWKWHLIPLDPANYYLEWVPIHLSWPMVLLINAGTIVITLLVLIGPSALVAKIAPSRAILTE